MESKYLKYKLKYLALTEKKPIDNLCNTNEDELRKTRRVISIYSNGMIIGSIQKDYSFLGKHKQWNFVDRDNKILLSNEFMKNLINEMKIIYPNYVFMI